MLWSAKAGWFDPEKANKLRLMDRNANVSQEADRASRESKGRDWRASLRWWESQRIGLTAWSAGCGLVNMWLIDLISPVAPTDWTHLVLLLILVSLSVSVAWVMEGLGVWVDYREVRRYLYILFTGLALFPVMIVGGLAWARF